MRVVLGGLAVVALAVLVFALFADSPTIKLPLMVSGLAVLGICLGVLGFSLAGSAARIGEHGRTGRALLVAFVGGLFVLAAAGSLAVAIILGILAWAG